MSGWLGGKTMLERSVCVALVAGALAQPAWAEVPDSDSSSRAGAVSSGHVGVEAARVTALGAHARLPTSLDPTTALGGRLPALATVGDPPSSRSPVPNVGSNNLGVALVVLGVVAGVGSLLAVIVAATD